VEPNIPLAYTTTTKFYPIKGAITNLNQKVTRKAQKMFKNRNFKCSSKTKWVRI